MSYYEYKVVPAPDSVPKARGGGIMTRVAQGIAAMLNAEGRAGWEYMRTETMTLTLRRGPLSRRKPHSVTMLIFRREVVADEDQWDDGRVSPEMVEGPASATAQQVPEGSDRGGMTIQPLPSVSASRKGGDRPVPPLPGTSEKGRG